MSLAHAGHGHLRQPSNQQRATIENPQKQVRPLARLPRSPRAGSDLLIETMGVLDHLALQDHRRLQHIPDVRSGEWLDTFPVVLARPLPR